LLRDQSEIADLKSTVIEQPEAKKGKLSIEISKSNFVFI
jgi:hypothetical protein